MSLFNTQPQYGYYGYQQPNPVQQLQSSVNQFGQNLNYAINGEPEYSAGRLTSWGIGGVAAWGACANAMARSGGPGGFMVLAAIGVGAFFGNMAYDWYLRNVKYKM